MNNKKRILSLIQILKKHSSETKHLKYSEIATLMEEEGILLNSRQTLYSDIAILNEYGYNIEYEKGYYLLDAPFYLSEIKLLIDSINSLKELDTKMASQLRKKLLSFISEEDARFLLELDYVECDSRDNLLTKLELILNAIRKSQSIFIESRYSDTESEIFPLFLHRENDHYYVYYHYESKEKIYHYRFDSIRSIKPGSKKDEMNISKDKITEQIKLSSDSFLSGEKALVNIKILNHSKRIAERLLNDFPSGILTNEGICVRTAVNNMFYSKLCAYGKDIVILNEDIKRRYYTYLLEITMDNNQ